MQRLEVPAGIPLAPETVPRAGVIDAAAGLEGGDDGLLGGVDESECFVGAGGDYGGVEVVGSVGADGGRVGVGEGLGGGVGEGEEYSVGDCGGVFVG